MISGTFFPKSSTLFAWSKLGLISLRTKLQDLLFGMQQVENQGMQGIKG